MVSHTTARSLAQTMPVWHREQATALLQWPAYRKVLL